MQPDNSNVPPTAPEPETNPLPPNTGQPQTAAPQFAAQFDNHAAAQPVQPTQASQSPVAGQPFKFPSAFSLFQPSSQLVLKNLTTFVVIIMLPAAYFALLERFFNPKTANSHVGVWLGLAAVGVIYNLVVFAAIPVLELRVVQGLRLGVVEAVKLGWRYFWRMLGLYIVVGAVIFIGFVLFIVPGVIMVRRYTLAAYFLVDQDVGIFEAMRRSAAATKGYSGAIWGLLGVQVLIGAPGWIPFIGPILSAGTAMLYGCAPALRYEEFKTMHTGGAPVQPQSPVPTNPVGN